MGKEQTAVAIGNEQQTLAVMTESDVTKKLAEFETFNQKVEVTREYLELEEGEPLGVVYLGPSLFKNQEKEIMVPAVDFLICTGEKKGRFAIAAQAVIVSTIGRYPEGTPFEIIYTGEKKLEAGKKLKEYSIKALFVGKKTGK